MSAAITSSGCWLVRGTVITITSAKRITIIVTLMVYFTDRMHWIFVKLYKNRDKTENVSNKIYKNLWKTSLKPLALEIQKWYTQATKCIKNWKFCGDLCSGNSVRKAKVLYLQFNSSYVAKSRCETVAETQIDHKALTVEFKTYRNGYQTILGGARSYTIAQKIQAGTNTYSNGVIYSTLTDHATGVNFIAGSVTVNSSTTLSATLGSRSAGW